MAGSGVLLAFAAALACAADAPGLSQALAHCTVHLDLIACGEALHIAPNDPGALLAEAGALLALKRPGEAIGVFRNASRHGAAAGAVNAKILAAEAQRRVLVRTCETSAGEVGRSACESAWLPGAPDEVAVIMRRGWLLRADDEFSPALDQYIQAARLRPGDRRAARAVVDLGDLAGRRDAPALAARGAALISLDRPEEAIKSLRGALQLSPDLAAAKSELRIAERAVAADRRALAARRAALEPRRYTNDAPVTRTN